MEVKACRICLATDVKLHSLQQEPLRTAIDFVINVHNDPSSFPCYVCHECSPQLLRCSKFIEQTRNTQSVLFRIYIEQGEVTETAIKALTKPNSDQMTEKTIQNEEDFKDDMPLASILRVEVSSIKSEDGDCMDLNDGHDFKEDAIEKMVVEVHLGDEEKPRKRKRRRLNERSEESLQKKIKTEKSKTKPKSTAKRKYTKKQSKTDEPLELEGSDNTKEIVKEKRKKRALDAQLSKFFTIVMLSYEEQLAEVESRKQSPLYSNSPHSCPLCYKTYQRVDSFNNHMAEHDPSRGPLECAVCRKRFSKRRVLSRHLRTSHEMLYRCQMCPRTCRARQAQSHMNKHEGVTETIKCAQCDFVTDQRSKYLRHVARTHGPKHECTKCNKRFVTERGLATHVKRGHMQTQGDQSYRCEECDVSFRTESAWKVHMTTAEKHRELNERSNVCKKCFASFDTLEQLTAHNNDVHAAENVYPKTCTICAAVLRSNKESWLHVVHSHPENKRSYRSLIQRELCELCGKGFKSVTDLRMHSLRHSGPRSVSCPRCPRRFYDRYQARMHERNVHCDRRPHSCVVCRRQFKVKGNMTRHMLVHTGERPHSCGVCGKSFSQAASRDLHHRTVHLRLPHPPRRRGKRPKGGNAEAAVTTTE